MVMYLMSSPWRNAWLRVQERKKGKKVELREEKARKGRMERKEIRKWLSATIFPRPRSPTRVQRRWAEKSKDIMYHDFPVHPGKVDCQSRLSWLGGFRREGLGLSCCPVAVEPTSSPPQFAASLSPPLRPKVGWTVHLSHIYAARRT